jgi:hypothetical protein
MSLKDKFAEVVRHFAHLHKSHLGHAEDHKGLAEHHAALAKATKGEAGEHHDAMASHHDTMASRHEDDASKCKAMGTCLKSLADELGKTMDMNKLAPLPAGFRIAPDRDRPDIRPGIAMVTRTGQQAVSAAAAPIEFHMEKLFTVDRMDERDSEGV